MMIFTCSAADDMTIYIGMLQGEQQDRFNTPVFVAGVWHYVNITMTQAVDELSLRFYKGDSLSNENKNETNYYEWRYDRNNAPFWDDISGYSIKYIKQDLCINRNTVYSFCIGIKDMLPNIVDYYENWTIEVSRDGTTIYSQGIVLEKAKTGISISKPSSILFRVDPFTSMDAQGDTFFKIGNVGNIPFQVDFDQEKYSDVEITDIDIKFLPDETITHYVIVHSKNWPPGFKKMNIQLIGSYPQSYFVDTNATVTLYTSFVIDVPQLVIYVGHSNYQIEEIDGTDIIFQYLEKLNMYEGEIRDITAYVSGNGAVTVEVQADEKNISALTLYDGATETRSPLSFLSTNTSERNIVVTVKALSEGKTGVLTYLVTCNGVTKTYTTKISIGPPAAPDKESGSPASFMQIVVVLVILLVVIYMIVSYIKNRTR
jgi:hypothetical protein